MRVQDDVGRFRIHPEIEFVRGRERELRVVGLGIDAAAHDDQFFDQLWKFGVFRNGQRQVSHRPCGIDGDLVGILPHHTRHKARDGLFRRFDRWRALWHWRNFIWSVHSVPSGKIPSSLVDKFAMEGFPFFDVLLAAD